MNDFYDYTQRHPLPPQNPHQPLTEDECDELFTLFDDDCLSDSTMSAEMADGYMTACVVGPVPVPAHEWMQAIFDQPTLPDCADADKQHRLLQLLLRRHQDITVATSMTPKQVNQENFFLPLFLKVAGKNHITPYQLDENGRRQGDWTYKEWAAGFSLPIQSQPAWHRLVDDRKNSDMLSPIVLFSLGYSPDQPELQIDEKEDLQLFLSLNVYRIRDFWKQHKEVRVPPLNQAAKVGRNDPCPCSSGKKYKKCCGA